MAQMTSEEAGRAEIIRQIKHFTKLGEGKPHDHEYNLTARGLSNILADEPVAGRKLHIWTCESLSVKEAIDDGEYGLTLSQALEKCPCLSSGCNAKYVEVTYTAKVAERIGPDRVEDTARKGR